MSGEVNQVRQMIGKNLFTIESGRTALIVIDLQNAFLESGAAFEIPEGRKAIPNIGEIVKECRKQGIPVVWTQSDHSPPFGGLILKKYPVIMNEKVLWRKNRSFELYPKMLQPLPSEFRVVKHKYDAFFQTDLEMTLRNLGKDTIIITGVDTCVCCESTARSAFFRDFKVAFIGDATASYNPSYHSLTLQVINDIFGRVLTTKELLEELQTR